MVGLFQRVGGIGAKALAAILVLGACSPDEPEGKLCVSGSALTAADRKLVGMAAPYPADGTLRARTAELSMSQRTRREVAWHTASKVLEAVPLAEPLPAAFGLPARIPRWQTWYDEDDLRRVFLRLYEGLSTQDKERRAPFSDAALDEVFLWNASAADEPSGWSARHYQAYLDAIDEKAELAGVGGISRVSFSPSAARHILQSYPQVLRCRAQGTPPAHEVGPLVVTPVARTAVEVGPCAQHTLGSYALGADESLHAVLEGGELAGDGAVLRLSAGEASCEAAAGEACEMAGPATVRVSVTAGHSSLRSVVALERHGTRPPWATCLDGAFPQDSVVVKADYRRADFGMTLPVYDTDAAALRQRLSGDVSWEQADGEAEPGEGDIYTLRLPNGARYRLAALHIMTKELDHWQWVTLWWSQEPGTDFGADRPLGANALKGAWAHYKMCAVTAFDERDARAGGGLEGSYPSLAEALSAGYAGVGAPTWCSNPYLELGHNNAGTNCVGCHQHGGTLMLAEEILAQDGYGRGQSRNNFPADYSWSLVTGTNLAQLFADAELYYLGPPD